MLPYLRDPAATLRRLVAHLAPGGAVATQDFEMAMVPVASRPMPLHAMAQGWLHAMLLAEGADPSIGLKLWDLLDGAGLVVGGVRAEPVVQTSDVAWPVGAIVLAVLPRLLSRGIVTHDEVEPATLQDRLDAERRGSRATFVGDVRFGAWGRLPG